MGVENSLTFTARRDNFFLQFFIIFYFLDHPVFYTTLVAWAIMTEFNTNARMVALSLLLFVSIEINNKKACRLAFCLSPRLSRVVYAYICNSCIITSIICNESSLFFSLCIHSVVRMVCKKGKV